MHTTSLPYRTCFCLKDTLDGSLDEAVSKIMAARFRVPLMMWTLIRGTPCGGRSPQEYAEFADELVAQAVTGDDARTLITAAARDLL
jgi:hypothetical protein